MLSDQGIRPSFAIAVEGACQIEIREVGPSCLGVIDAAASLLVAGIHPSFAAEVVVGIAVVASI